MMRLRPPAVLKVSLRNAYPRCYVTRRIAVDEGGNPTAGAYYGPFASSAEAQRWIDEQEPGEHEDLVYYKHQLLKPGGQHGKTNP